MKAKIIGPESELGDIGEGLKFFNGRITLTREDGDDLTDLTSDEIKTLRGNKYVQVTGEDDAQDVVEAQSNSVIKARLTELGVKFDGRSNADKLKGQLEKAEADKAKADEKAKAADDKAKSEAETEITGNNPVSKPDTAEAAKFDDKNAKASAAASSEEA